MTPEEIIVFDRPLPCPYLAGLTARLPYRLPVEPLSPQQFDERLAEGDRRSGVFLYRTECPGCRACEPIRLNVSEFRPDSTQRRMKHRGDRHLTVHIGEPIVDRQRVDLFNLHRTGRGLVRDDGSDSGPIDERSYTGFLTETCCETIELSYWYADQLVAIAISDCGQDSLSAVYCFYDPSFRLLSLGTYSILRQVELCRASGRRFLYLGFYVENSPRMSYKARFRPHQRLVGGRWTDFR
jgi:arginyl-tRNA--protein-N-Asp/Glu arginylyltransferase